ncbi:hypothetical protein [Sporosarcina sp. BP05]|uniref:hypothetical protein n=1 Tax=Sporosarcina sp. BP05 TaxID=2758726 RepID=UPI001647864F|nr:hypothetical protein [Sporosarcina sp. BP05]
MADEKIPDSASDIPVTKSPEPKYLASVIYDNKSNDKSLIIKNYETDKQKELAIETEFHKFFVRNKENNKIDLEFLLNRDNYNKLVNAERQSEVESFILNTNELNLLEKENILDQSIDTKLAIAINEYRTDNFDENTSIENEQELYNETLNEIKNKTNNLGLAFTEDDGYSVQVSLDIENLAYKTEVELFEANQYKETIVIYDSVDEMIRDVKKLDFSEMTNSPVHDFENELEQKKALEQKAKFLLKENGYAISDGNSFDFSDEQINSFILNKSLENNQENDYSLHGKWTELENKYHELGNTVSPDKLNQVTEKLVKNKLDFNKSLSDDMTNNRIVTILQSDKVLLKHSVDHLQRSKMYALLSSAKNELANVRIKNNGLESEREAILKDKIVDLENRVSPPPKATLENVNAKVNSASNVRATAKSLKNVQTKTQVHENTNVKEPARPIPKKTRSIELSR